MKNSPLSILLHKNTKGFSIVEILIGMSIFSIGILAVATMQLSAVKNNKTGNTFTQASTLARTQMEIIKNGDVSDPADILNPAAFPTTINDPNNPVDENGNPGGIYNRSWIVDNFMEDTDDDGVGDSASTLARTVTVTVTFPFAGSDTRQVTLTSVTAGDGL